MVKVLMKIIKKIFNSLVRKWALTSERRYISYLRSKGIIIGSNCMIPNPETINIDLTRPSLVEIGDYVRLNKNFFLRTHDGGFYVLRHLFGEFISASGRVKIGNNVKIGARVVVNEEIPDNTAVYSQDLKVSRSKVLLDRGLHDKHLEYLHQVLPKYH